MGEILSFRQERFMCCREKSCLYSCKFSEAEVAFRLSPKLKKKV